MLSSEAQWHLLGQRPERYKMKDDEYYVTYQQYSGRETYM